MAHSSRPSSQVAGSPLLSVENVAHTLTALALARAGLGRASPLGTTALVLGANLPDIDLLWSLGNDLRYLHQHRGWTHSLLGGVVGSLAL
jgi:inner membrane protein